MIANSIERITERNPQLTREWKGRLTPKNSAIATALSIVGQILLYLYFQDRLPTTAGLNRYCTGKPPEELLQTFGYLKNTYCIHDLNGQWMIVPELWWLDIFISLSIIGIFALLVVGTYQLIADLSTEERRGTLNFIRLSPRSAREIFLGKILGVPVLLYWVAIFAVPFHLFSGFSAGIPIPLILAFYAVLVAACGFFYSVAIAFALVGQWLGSFQAWLGSGFVLLFLFYTSLLTLSGYGSFGNPLDWLNLFYPGAVLPYLVRSTYLPPDAVDYMNFGQLSRLLWYGQSLWRFPISGIGFILFNYALWTYWLSKALARRYQNPLATLIDKTRSYAMTGCFCVLALGFVIQTLEPRYLFDNFAIVTTFLALFALFLTFALTPSRQTVQDWARYRHREKGKQNSLKALLFSDKSPATLAIAANLAIALCSLLPAIWVSPLGDYKLATLGGLLLAVNMILLYAAIAQLVMLWKTNKRSLVAGGTIATLVTFPILCLGIFAIGPNEAPIFWSFTAFPMLAARYVTTGSIAFAVFGQWIGLTLVSWQINRQVRQLGASATKTLLVENGVR